jgi:hypothetical protein
MAFLECSNSDSENPQELNEIIIEMPPAPQPVVEEPPKAKPGKVSTKKDEPAPVQKEKKIGKTTPKKQVK